MKFKPTNKLSAWSSGMSAKCIQLLVLAVAFLQVSAQNQTPVEVEKIAPSIEFSSIQNSDNTISLKAILRAKTKSGALKLYDMKVSFSNVTDSGEKVLGTAITNANGTALFTCKSDGLQTDGEGKLHFKALLASNKIMEEASEELSIKKARLMLTPIREDSTYTIALKLTDLSLGTEQPMKDAALTVLVKRSFYPLKIGEGSTDENGEASIVVPAHLPGDAKGRITVLGRLEGNDEYGTVEATTTQAWGNPVSDQFKELPRALWSSHPPLWMLITFIILVTTVWGHYFVIIYELFRLRKEH